MCDMHKENNASFCKEHTGTFCNKEKSFAQFLVVTTKLSVQWNC